MTSSSHCKYGTWASPISATEVSTASVRLGDVVAIDGAFFWAETRPDDNGRCVIVKAVGSAAPVDMYQAPFNTRTRVHEYGGGAWWVDKTYLYFVHWNDQRIYRVAHQGSAPTQPEAITPEPKHKHGLRYADGAVHPDGIHLVCVRESHDAIDEKVTNEIVLIKTRQRAGAVSTDPVVIANGADFYSTPRFSQSGESLSWIEWQHPQMPWDGTELKVVELDRNLQPKKTVHVAGSASESIMGATWARNGCLVFASDRSGWWNLYAVDITSQYAERTLTHFNDREVGVPPWVFATQRFVELPSENALRFAAITTRNACDQMVVVEADGSCTELDTPFVQISSLSAAADGTVLLNGSPNDSSACITHSVISPEANGNDAAVSPWLNVKPPAPLAFANSWISTPESITLNTDGREVHAFFYTPRGAGLSGSDNELPPLVVMGHGGPTGHSTAAMKLSIQFWTSRGIAVVDVNYSGSSGYGRDYRRRLAGQWGVIDVEDCIAAAQHLAATARVDPARMVIRGGSAGGLTVLRALQTSECFAGGTTLYGVTDLAMLAQDTHKFESRYLDGLLGGTIEEQPDIYRERSPIHHCDDLSCPILILQGDEDEVVPPSQSAAIADAAAKKGLPHAYVLFTGEQHGFRQTENVVRALELELWFYGQVLGFDPADQIEAPVEARGF